MGSICVSMCTPHCLALYLRAGSNCFYNSHFYLRILYGPSSISLSLRLATSVYKLTNYILAGGLIWTNSFGSKNWRGAPFRKGESYLSIKYFFSLPVVSTNSSLWKDNELGHHVVYKIITSVSCVSYFGGCYFCSHYLFVAATFTNWVLASLLLLFQLASML